MITNLDIQLLAWFIGIIALVMSVFILLLYIPQRANRWLCLMLLYLAINSYATGIMAGAKTINGAMPGLMLSAFLVPAIIPGMLLAGLTLLKPTWLNGRWKPNRIMLQVLTILPMIFIGFDVIFGTHLMHKATPLNNYSGGIVGLINILNGPAGIIFYVVNVVASATVASVILVNLAGFDKSLSPLTHRLAWISALSQIAILLTLVIPGDLLMNALFPLVGTLLYIAIYTYATYQLSAPERLIRDGKWEVKGRQRRQIAVYDRQNMIRTNSVLGGLSSLQTKVSMQTRLTLLILSVCLPVLIITALLVNQRMNQQIRQEAGDRLQSINQSITGRVNIWLAADSHSLNQIALLSSIQDMDAEQQKPVLQAMLRSNPDYSLVSTVDLNGFNVARSDQAPLEDYQDRAWFHNVKTGAAIAYQITQDKVSGKPVFEMAVPINNNQGILIGACMLSIEPARFSSLLSEMDLGKTGFWYVLDDQNKMVFSSVPDLALRDYSHEPPVAYIRQVKSVSYLPEFTPFTDNTGQEWLADAIEMSSGWVVIAQQQKSELYRGINQIGQITVVILIIGALLLTGLVWMAIRQAVQPFRSLTETTSAIASGELTRVAQVDRDDEIGILGRAVNAITSQLRNSNSELEKQIAERTLDLEVRSSYLQASAEVSRIVASILDPDQLSQEVVDLIRERFGLYFVGLFQVDQNKEWAILKAGTGKAGQNRVTRGYRVPVGNGMIGWSIANSQPRISTDTGRDAGWNKQNELAKTNTADTSLINELTIDLPDTHSEAALPLRSRGQVIGALSLQSAISGAFDKDNIAVFQMLADQVAIALDNAQLFAESQETLRTMQQIYGEMSREAWDKLLHEQIAVAYRADIQGVNDVTGHNAPGNEPETEQASLHIPIKVRGNVIGKLDTHKTIENPDWKPEEVAMVQTVVDQLGLALESAQLYREAQYRAERERVIGSITTQMRESLDVDIVLQTAVREMRDALGLQDIAIHLGESPALNISISEEPTEDQNQTS